MPFPESLLSQLNQPPEKAVEFLNKKFPVLKADYDALNVEAQARAFTIAQITQLDVLQTVLTGMQTALQNGTGGKEFTKQLKPYLEQTGWLQSGDDSKANGKAVSRRLELIYKTATDQSIAFGRWQQLWDNRESRPYVQYRIDQLGVSERHRVEHELLNGRVFRIDDPVWDVIYPPRGFRCNCGVVSVSDAYLKRKKLTVEDSGKNLVVSEDGALAYKVKGTDGKEVFITAPRGFEQNIGKAGLTQLDDVFINKLSKISTPESQRRIALELINNPVRVAEFEQWVQNATSKNYQANGSMRTIGVLQKEILEQLQQSGITPESQIIVVSDKNLQHANRDEKVKSGKSLGIDGLKRLPQYVADPDFILSEQNTPNDFIYITLNTSGGKTMQDITVVSMNHILKKKGVSNVAVTAQTLPMNTYLKDDKTLRDDKKYSIIYRK